MSHGDVWATDTPVSRPEPMDPDLPVLIDLGGFGMTAGGIAHALTSSDLDEIFTPTYAPEGYRGV